MNGSLDVAPRELYDLIDRILRVEGIDPGATSRIARAVVHGEAAGRHATHAVCDMLDRGVITDLVDALDAIAAAEVETRRTGSAEIVLAEPVAEPLVLAALAEAAARGARRTASAATERGVTSISLELDDPRAPVAPESAAGGRHIRLPRDLFDELTRRAASFLVPEPLLDALPPHEPGSVTGDGASA